MAPILLDCAPTTQEFDEAGIVVKKRVLPTYNPGHYTHKLLPNHMKSPDTLDYVPSLEYFCLKTLYTIVDSIDLGGFPRILFHPEGHIAWLRGLIPFFTSDMRDTDLKYVDPRLWGTLIQLYSMLPPCFGIYTLPLSDTHLTQLQAIRSTPEFTLMTVLDLSSRRELTDETIGELKPLTNLCVLDLSLTRVGSWGVKKLSMCLVRNANGRIGPWGLRVWSLRRCKRVDDTVKDALAKFPLLSAVDLRDTSVSPLSHLPGFTSRPATHNAFYYPNPPLSWINGLCDSFPDCQIFQSSDKGSLYTLHINTLEHAKLRPPNRFRERINKENNIGEHDRVLALLSNGREALYTTHQISKDSEQEDRPGGILSEKPPKTKGQRRDTYGPDETYGFGFGHIGEVDGSEHDRLSEHDLWCDEGLENDLSESDDFEHGQGPFEDRRASGPFDFHPNTPQDYSMSQRELLQLFGHHNEVAALVTERHTAEQEARMFYSELDTREGASAGRLLKDRNDQATGIPYASGTGLLHSPAPQLLPTKRQWSHMFFRKPPAYDTINHARAPATEQVDRTRPDETIVAKKRKTEARPAGIPAALLNRPAAAEQQLERAAMNFGCSQSTRGFEALVTQWPGGKSQSHPLLVSRNPFLAKVMRPARSSSSLTLNLPPPTPPCQNTTPSLSRLTASTVQPRSDSKSQRQWQPKSKPSPTPVTSTATNINDDTKGSRSKKTDKNSLDREKMVTIKERKVKQIFDMRAWAMQTNK